MNSYVLVLQVVAIISLIGSSTVILTLVLFPDMRKKLFMQIIAFISIADFIGNLPYSTAYRPVGTSPTCKVEGFMNLYFYPVSWAWTTILVYFLYSLALFSKLPLSKLKIHLLCWGLPLFFTLMTLTTNTYGRADGSTEDTVCSYSGPKLSGFLWHLLTYYGFWFVCVACMVAMYWRIIDLKKKDQVKNISILKLATDSLYLYPMIMFWCWLLRVITACIQFSGADSFYGFALLNSFSDCFKILHGFCAAVIFFYKSAEARQRWFNLSVNLAVMVGIISSGRAPTIDRSSIVSDFSLEYEQSEEDIMNLAVNQPADGYTEEVVSPQHPSSRRSSMEIQ